MKKLCLSNLQITATILILVIITFAIIATKHIVFPVSPPMQILILPKQYPAIADQAVSSYRNKKIEHNLRIGTYDPFGDYLNYGTTKFYRSGGNVKLDTEGLPQVKYGNEFHYNPVTLSQYALSKYGAFLNGNTTALHSFKKACEKLLELQGKDGSFRYSFPYRYYLTKEIFQPGWISGMAQGQALSVFARAYHITREKKYLEAGNTTLKFLVTPIAEGGPRSTLSDLHPSLSTLIFFEEYISRPNNYTLNGFMFTLLGLYDWSQITFPSRIYSSLQARYFFRRGLLTLKSLLPYYDIHGFSAYDLGHYFINKPPHVIPRYHAAHIQLLHALNSVSPDPVLEHYEKLLVGYVQ